jgi:1-acyl-sn-glycerol-3-phosphate acyltransferase
VWDSHARFWHGYEVCGMENLPKDGPALIIYYHGAIPIDMYYLVARVYLERNQLIYTVGDRFLSKLPGNLTDDHGNWMIHKKGNSFEFQVGR